MMYSSNVLNFYGSEKVRVKNLPPQVPLPLLKIAGRKLLGPLTGLRAAASEV